MFAPSNAAPVRDQWQALLPWLSLCDIKEIPGCMEAYIRLHLMRACHRYGIIQKHLLLSKKTWSGDKGRNTAKDELDCGHPLWENKMVRPIGG
jgi:hypothetical protein